MDYNDDGDFQSQKFHLAGEDNIKFSSGLQSFALPNFDLDQHLQVHSGFDNFVESRDLLTITGEEDNWIDNFSPGRSAIGFSSNAAESCSISRHHNIWSEATSSESVEMLLKSVGEDDMMENKIIAEKNNVSKGIKTTVTDSFGSKMEDTIKNDLASSLDTCQNRLPEVSKGLVDSLTPVEVASSKDETPVQVRPMDLVGSSVQAEKLDIDHPDGEKLLPSPCSYLEDSRLVDQPPRYQIGQESLQKENISEHLHVAEATSVVPVVNDCQTSISLSTRLENVQVDVDSQAGTSDINVNRAHGVIGVDGKDILHDKSGKLSQDQRVENEVSQESIEIDEKKTCGRSSGGSGDSPIAPTDSTIPLMGGCEEHVCPNNRNSLVQIGIEQVNLPKEDSCRTSDQIVTSLEQNYTSTADLAENENITEASTPLQNQSVAEAIDGCNVPLHSKCDDLVHVSDEQVEVAKGGSASGANIVTTPGQKSIVILEDVSRPEAVSFELKHENSKPSVSILVINPTSEAVEGCAELKCSKNCDASVEIDVEPVEIVKGSLTSSQMSKALNEEHSETVPDVSGKEAQHVEINMDISEPSIPLVESVHQCNIIEREPSTGEEKHDSRSFQPENNDFGENDTSHLAEEAYLFSCETDKKPMSELREADKQRIQELDVMVTNKSPEGCPEEDTVQKRPDLSAEISNSRELPSSSASLGTPSPVLENTSPRPELVEDRDLEITAYPVPVSSVCSGGGCSKSGQIPSESCPSHVVSYNSHSEILHTSVSDSENKAPTSDGSIPGKTTSSFTEASNPVQTFVPAAVLPNEHLQSTMVNVAESECVVMEGLSIAAVDEEKDAPDKLHLEERVKEALDVSVAGNTLNLKSDSELAVSSHKVIEDSSSLETGSCHNSFDHGRQSPKTISCSQNPHDGGENKDKSTALSENILSIPSDLSSRNKESHGQTESLVENPKGSNAIKDDKSFTFEVGKISEGEKNIMWKPFSSIQTSEGARSCEEVPRKSGYDQGDFSQTKTSQGSGQSIPNDSVHRNASKEERRSIAASGSSSKKKLSKDKPFPKKRTEWDDNSNTSNDGYAFGNGRKDLQLGAIQPCPLVEGVIVKSSCSSAAQASNLPDLNTATSSPHLLINKPFTDIQQVQLRAQIFVYGSLIQGIPPDETCMISAFGDSDAGRSAWEGVWRAAVEKHENHRSPLAGCETPASHSVTKTDQSLKRTVVQSKMVPTPSCQSGSKGPPTIFSPLSWPSPVWTGSAHDKVHSSMPRGSYANQMLSPLHAYQSPHVRSYTGNISPWLTQPACSVPWITHTATPDISTPLPVMPVAETAQVTSRGTSLPSGSNIQFKSSGGSPGSGGVGVVSTNSEVQVTATRKEVTPRSKKPISSDQKSRRQKKGTVSEPFGHTLPVSEPCAELPVTVPTPAKTSNGASSAGFLKTVSPALSYTPFQVVGAGQKVLFSEETCSKIEQAKLQAEDAAVLASAAVRHSEAIWSQLAIQKNSGKMSEVERKLASAAVAAAAAVSVAKAASAAAKVAADSALHAKMMADEAMSSGNVGKTLQSSGTVDPSEENDVSAVTPSTFTGKDKNNSSYSIIPAAREAARRRLEAASAATKQAENLDAIVRAAELAAEAVCQAGSIAAMGDPLPFSLREIIEAGPGGYWKTHQLKSEHFIKAKSLHGEKQLTISNQLLLHESEVHVSEKEVFGTAGGDAICSPTEASVEQNKKNEGHSPKKITDSADKKGQPEIDLIDGTIQKGSLVEVLSNVKGPGGVWYSGRVLDLKDDKAYVRYNERLSDEGSDKTKEWVPLHSEAEKAPSIRIAHPIAGQNAGARKRRRTVDLWFVGDCVDAWVNDGWREGVITEKSDEDTPNFVVHFAAGGDTLVFRSWDLRPSLVWKDGQWVEWCRSLNNISEHLEIQEDTRQQKRIKMSDTVGKNITDTVAARPSRISRNLRSADSKKLEEFVPLQLDPKERQFSFGKIREENVPERIKRIGLQKEGSKVVFGIPKPGKKRKFMDMSKHCVVGNTEKTRAGSQGSDPAKYAKTFIPQVSGGWKNVSKADARNKRGAVEKPKVPRPRSRNVHNQPSASNANSSVSALRTSNGQGNGYGGVAAGRSLEKKNVNDIDSSANITATAQGLSNLLPSPAIPPAIKSADVAADEAEGNNILHDMEKATSHEERCSGHVEIPGKMAHDIIEPRRSVRRIQPTSRLLEGLQSSSLSITKSSSSSHDRGGRASHKAGSSSRVHAHR